jgi:ATP-dependent helicase HepA
VKNAFVRDKSNDLGIGKVIVTYGDLATVEYFVSIDRRQRVESPIRALRVADPLPRHTTCYFLDESDNWHIGHIDTRSGEGYRVKGADGTASLVSRSALFVRCNLPSPDPLDALAAYCFTDPLLHDRRHEFLRYALGARAATLGLTGLSSSRIKLYAHQIEVVRRVLEDPIQRYLLADEVGLGKTVEAGIVLRQFLLDYPRESALLVAPSFLLDQWRMELFTKFTLHDLGIHRVTRIGMTELRRVRPREQHFGLLIVDEAHHAAAGAFAADTAAREMYAKLSELAHATPRVLLLSATPVLHHEPDFLAMLHLLDPTVYRLEDLEAFRARVSSRQVVGKLLLLLREDTSAFIVRQLLSDLDGLASAFKADARLAELISTLRAALSKDELTQAELDAAIQPVRVHIAETYRLHRRLLRTRREAMNGELVSVRAGCKELSDCGEAAAALNGFLEQWRQVASDHAQPSGSEVEKTFVGIYGTLLEAAGTWEGLFRAAITSRLDQRYSPLIERELGATAARSLVKSPLIDGESELLRAMQDVAASVDRIGVLLALHQKGSIDSGKTVIFTAYTCAASAIAERIESIFGLGAVARHLSSESADAVEETVKSFREAETCRFLVCDRSGEEGRNLQFVDQIVHFDIPLAPNRVEQRIGRVDRIGRSDIVLSHALTGPPCDISAHRAWYRLLSSGFGVFTESIAGLQFLVDRMTPRLVEALFNDGAAGLDSRLDEVRKEIASEKRRNAEQSALDELEALNVSGRDYIKKMEEFDSDPASISGAVERWVCEALGFHRELLDASKYIVRYRAASTTTLAADRVQELAPLLATTGTYDRTVATAATTLRLFRPGEPFIDAMIRHAEWEDRGRAFAVWRWDAELPTHDFEWIGFRFRFIVEPDIDAADEVFDQAKSGFGSSGKPLTRIDRRAFRRQAEAFFPAWVQTSYVDTDGRPQQDERALVRLRRPYQSGAAPSLQDFVLWNHLRGALDELVDPGRWRDIGTSARRAAEVHARGSEAFQARVRVRYEQAAVELRRRLDQLQARAAIEAKQARGLTVTPQDVELERRLSDLLLAGMQAPKLRLDSAGLLILSGRKPRGAR